MIIGYLNVCEKNISIDEQRQIIEQYAKIHGLVIDVFSTSDNIRILSKDLKTSGHTILLANIVSLGNSLFTIKENLKSFLKKNITVISSKENLIVEPNRKTEWLIEGIELSIDIRNSMISTITKNALEEKKASGHKLGRSFGRKNKKRIWEGKEEAIKNKLLSGMTRQETADEVGISIVSLYNYLKQNPGIKQLINGGQNA